VTSCLAVPRRRAGSNTAGIRVAARYGGRRTAARFVRRPRDPRVIPAQPRRWIARRPVHAPSSPHWGRSWSARTSR
jgi:hypothetical protein